MGDGWWIVYAYAYIYTYIYVSIYIYYLLNWWFMIDDWYVLAEFENVICDDSAWGPSNTVAIFFFFACHVCTYAC